MPLYTEIDIMTFFSKAYHGYRTSHNNHLPYIIWVSKSLYELYKANLHTLERFTSMENIPIIEQLKYKSAWVRPIEVIGVCVLKTTRCTGRYNG